MIWLTWRQFRMMALPVFGVLGVVAAALALTGPRLYREYAFLLARCEHGCIGDIYDHFFFPHLGAYAGLILLVTGIPAVLGAFWGVPLVSREFETGTDAAAFASRGRPVLFIDEHADVCGKEAYVPGGGEIVERRLQDGRTFRIVKNFVDPPELQERLRELGWDCQVHREGTDWVRGEARVLG